MTVRAEAFYVVTQEKLKKNKSPLDKELGTV